MRIIPAFAFCLCVCVREMCINVFVYVCVCSCMREGGVHLGVKCVKRDAGVASKLIFAT